MRKPSDCANCGSEHERHSGRDRAGYCFDGGHGEDATTYERAGFVGIFRSWLRGVTWRLKFRDVDFTEI